MAEYIDINQLWKCETCYHHQTYGCTLGIECDYGESYRPAYSKLKKADVAPIVHGYWISRSHNRLDNKGRVIKYCDFYYCSECETSRPIVPPYNYCPNCGAKMCGGSENG